MRRMLRRLRHKAKQSWACAQILHHGLWFVDVPRTSSSSIRAELAGHFGSVHGKTELFEEEFAAKSLFSAHQPASRMRRILGERAWEEIFTFTMVRNPWDRAVSLYAYRRRIGDIPEEWTFRDYVLRLGEANANTEYFQYYGYRWAAADFLVDSDGELLVDFVGRFETREHDLKHVAARVGFEGLGRLALQAASRGKPYRDFYDPETVAVIRTLHRKDIELFGYDFEA